MIKKKLLFVPINGQDGHGKTTLFEAIKMAMDVDKPLVFNYREEFYTWPDYSSFTKNVTYETPERAYDFVDWHNYTTFFNKMLSNEIRFKCAILVFSVVNFDEKLIKKEIFLAAQLGIKYLIVYLNKCDKVNPEDMISMQGKEDIIKRILSSNYYSGQTPIIWGAAQMVLNKDNNNPYGTASIQKLKEALENISDEANFKYEPRYDKNKPLFFMGGGMDFSNKETIIFGSVQSGKINIGDEVEIFPSEKFQSSIHTVDGIIEKDSRIRKVLFKPFNQYSAEFITIAAPGVLVASRKYKAIIYIYCSKDDECTKENSLPLNQRLTISIPGTFDGTSQYIYAQMVEFFGEDGVTTLDKAKPGTIAHATILFDLTPALPLEVSFYIRFGGCDIGVVKLLERIDC